MRAGWTAGSGLRSARCELSPERPDFRWGYSARHRFERQGSVLIA